MKVLEKVSDAVSDEELQKAHQVICSDFVTSYKEAAGVPCIKDKQLSSDLLKLLLSNDSWKPLSTAVVNNFHLFICFYFLLTIVYIDNLEIVRIVMEMNV